MSRRNRHQNPKCDGDEARQERGKEYNGLASDREFPIDERALGLEVTHPAYYEDDEPEDDRHRTEGPSDLLDALACGTGAGCGDREELDQSDARG